MIPKVLGVKVVRGQPAYHVGPIENSGIRVCYYGLPDTYMKFEKSRLILREHSAF